VRQNIIFGHTYDEDRYNEIIQVCALEEDLKQFPHGDKTVVGERGISLSGGQKVKYKYSLNPIFISVLYFILALVFSLINIGFLYRRE
jgi:hypothetical protein